jgi:hypothetical protein
MEQAKNAGAVIVKPAQKPSGAATRVTFKTPIGMWEVAWNPGFTED